MAQSEIGIVKAGGRRCVLRAVWLAVAVLIVVAVAVAVHFGLLVGSDSGPAPTPSLGVSIGTHNSCIITRAEIAIDWKATLKRRRGELWRVILLSTRQTSAALT